MHANFNPDSCSTLLGLPSCAEWLPDADAFLHLLTQQAPHWLGAWCLFAIVSASLSTSDGAILALGTVFARNVLTPLLTLLPLPSSLSRPKELLSKHMLLVARASTLPFAILGGAIAAYSDIAAQLLIVAFDIMLATAIAPLFGAFYVKDPSATAALLSSVTGAVARIVLEFALEKDGTFLLPYRYDEFKKYGPAASLKMPTSVDGNETTVWNPETEQCVQDGSFKDYSGIDSLTAFFASVVVFVVVQVIETRVIKKRLFRFPGDQGYDKMDEEAEGKEEKVDNVEENVEQIKEDLKKTEVENSPEQNI